MSRRIFLGSTSPKLGLMCLAHGHNAVAPVRLEPATPRSRVKHSTTEPLRSLKYQLLISFQGKLSMASGFSYSIILTHFSALKSTMHGISYPNPFVVYATYKDTNKHAQIQRLDIIFLNLDLERI